MIFSCWVVGKMRLHSPHSAGSSDLSLQSFCLLHTFSMLIHSPLLHLNLVGPSHTFSVEKNREFNCNLMVWECFASVYSYVCRWNKTGSLWESPMWQPISSLRSLQSCFLSHWSLPWIQVPSLHWKSSGRQVGWPRKRRQMMKTSKRDREKREEEWEDIDRGENHCWYDLLWIEGTEYEQVALDGNKMLCMLKLE